MIIKKNSSIWYYLAVSGSAIVEWYHKPVNGCGGCDGVSVASRWVRWRSERSEEEEEPCIPSDQGQPHNCSLCVWNLLHSHGLGFIQKTERKYFRYSCRTTYNNRSKSECAVGKVHKDFARVKCNTSTVECNQILTVFPNVTYQSESLTTSVSSKNIKKKAKQNREDLEWCLWTDCWTMRDTAFVCVEE